MSQQVLVLGSQGRFGAAAALAFSQAGWRVLCHARRPDARLPGGAQRVEAPLQDAAALVRQAKGSSLVIHAVNVPSVSYTHLTLPTSDLV